MDKVRLALVACKGPHDGPWMRLRGNEKAVKISFLGEGERVFFDYQTGDSQNRTVEYSSEGSYPLPEKGIHRGAFRKTGPGTKHTTVEFVVNA